MSKNDKPLYVMGMEQLLDLLKAKIREEESIRSSIRTTMNIYITVLIAVLGGLATLVAKTSENDNHTLTSIFLIIGGIIVITVAYVALQHFISGYRRQIEAIVQEAKLESTLGMDSSTCYPLKSYWKGESLLPTSFIETRNRFESSQGFVDWMVSNTDVKIAKVLYRAFIAVGFLVTVFGIVYLFL